MKDKIIPKANNGWVSFGASYTFEMSVERTDTYTSYPAAAKPKPKPIEKPKPKIFTTYSDEERENYMPLIERIKIHLKKAKWGGFCMRDYKIQKNAGHPDEFFMIAEKYNHYFFLKIDDKRKIEMWIEDPLCEKVHGFYLDYTTELESMVYAATLLIEYMGKIISLQKELRKINTKSRKFISGLMLESLEDVKEA